MAQGRGDAAAARQAFGRGDAADKRRRRGRDVDIRSRPARRRYDRLAGIGPRFSGVLSRRLPGEPDPRTLSNDAYLARVEDDADLTSVRRLAEREADAAACGRAVKGAGSRRRRRGIVRAAPRPGSRISRGPGSSEAAVSLRHGDDRPQTSRSDAADATWIVRGARAVARGSAGGGTSKPGRRAAGEPPRGVGERSPRGRGTSTRRREAVVTQASAPARGEGGRFVRDPRPRPLVESPPSVARDISGPVASAADVDRDDATLHAACLHERACGAKDPPSRAGAKRGRGVVGDDGGGTRDARWDAAGRVAVG